MSFVTARLNFYASVVLCCHRVSVRPLHTGIVPKWINKGSRKQRPISHHILETVHQETGGKVSEP